MEVKLINYTQNAKELLIFTKNTRLEMKPGLFDEIMAWPEDRKMDELKYMARTIPSSWEFCDFVFLVTGVTRAFTHQAVRTRNASYAQQTLRMVDVQEGFDVLRPELIEADEVAASAYSDCMVEILMTYKLLRSRGIPAEDARGVLPTNILTNIVCKYNLRTFSELCKSRTGGRTQNEYQMVVNLMADEALKVMPWVGLFLFPAGRDKFSAIEKALAELKLTNPALAYDAMKDVDLLRKEQ